MNPRLRLLAAALLAAAAVPALPAASRVVSDLQPAPKRQTSVDLASGLARRPAPGPLPGDLVSPFNPPGFDRPEPAARPAPAPATPASGATNPATPTPAPAAPAAAATSAPATPRETLEAIASQITPSGTMIFRGKPRLLIFGRPFEVGTRFTATYNNEDYELELVAIDRTTFTLRYRGEDVTRPIKPAR